MGSRKSIIREAIERLDTLMAIGESRFQAKQAQRAASPDGGWTVSTGKIHSHTTRKVYQQQVLAFINWARTNHGITRLAWLDERADELATQYLTEHVVADRSAYTLQTERAALRLFFGDWSLAATVMIPRRTRTTITRSRGPATYDRHFQPANWQMHIRFAQACGLRRAELRDLRVRDVYTADDGTLFVHVKNGKGGKAREVPVLSGHEEEVLSVVQGRAPHEKVFDHIPKHMDVHSYRRDSAQRRYLQQAPGLALPPVEGRLRHEDYDSAATQEVSWALGHNRLDVVLRHYLR
ncbi:MAG TPA: tyrosine-type recombinase/integrase [Ktedonobacteraceae bacterium]|jgi:integrase|nr:tyrosine-type recombinase/integrase [Ktedonobacteraceae bacterium]